MADTKRSRKLRFLVTGALLVGPAAACDDPASAPETVETINVTPEGPEGPIEESETDEPEPPDNDEEGTGAAAIEDLEAPPRTNQRPQAIPERNLGPGRHRPTPNLVLMQETPDED